MRSYYYKGYYYYIGYESVEERLDDFLFVLILYGVILSMIENKSIISIIFYFYLLNSISNSLSLLS